jgi:hypothetical protein
MKRVVLFGKSLVMSTVGASLQGNPDIQILLVDPSMPDVQHHLRTLQPDVVILDQATIQPDFSIALWKAQPGLLLIGLDLDTGKAMVLSSQTARLMTTNDLLQLLWRMEPSGAATVETEGKVDQIPGENSNCNHDEKANPC